MVDRATQRQVMRIQASVAVMQGGAEPMWASRLKLHRQGVPVTEEVRKMGASASVWMWRAQVSTSSRVRTMNGRFLTPIADCAGGELLRHNTVETGATYLSHGEVECSCADVGRVRAHQASSGCSAATPGCASAHDPDRCPPASKAGGEFTSA